MVLAVQPTSLRVRAVVMNFPEVIAAFAFFGAVVICPLVYMITRHQRTIAEIMHRNAGGDLHERVQMLEHEVRMIRAERNEMLIREDDQRDLPGRIPFAN